MSDMAVTLDAPGRGEVPAHTDPDGGDRLRFGETALDCRLIHGTGRFSSNDVLRSCLEAARPQMIPLAIRRLALAGGGRNELEGIDLGAYFLLPNTAGA